MGISGILNNGFSSVQDAFTFGFSSISGFHTFGFSHFPVFTLSGFHIFRFWAISGLSGFDRNVWSLSGFALRVFRQFWAFGSELQNGRDFCGSWGHSDAKTANESAVVVWIRRHRSQLLSWIVRHPADGDHFDSGCHADGPRRSKTKID